MSLVQDAPQMLPLSGSPRLTVLGREVRLGAGYADLIAMESSGRLVVIEVKLAGNAEVRGTRGWRGRSWPRLRQPSSGTSRTGRLSRTSWLVRLLTVASGW
jgi:RecB family endonuclease NucS